MRLTGSDIAKLLAQEPASDRIVEMVCVGDDTGRYDVPEGERHHLWVYFAKEDGKADSLRMDFTPKI